MLNMKTKGKQLQAVLLRYIGVLIETMCEIQISH